MEGPSDGDAAACAESARDSLERRIARLERRLDGIAEPESSKGVTFEEALKHKHGGK